MDKLKNKLDSIIDFSLVKNQTKWELEKIIELETKYQLELTDDYIFYLQFYGNTYTKDNYMYTPTYDISDITKQKTYDIGVLFGLNDSNSNLEKKICFYQPILPSGFFPIGDLHGGDLICMSKSDNKIYFWYHEEAEGNNIYLVEDSFEQFILNFNFCEEETKSTSNIKLNFSSELDEAIRKAAEKYKKK